MSSADSTVQGTDLDTMYVQAQAYLGSGGWAEAIALSIFLAILLIRAGALARESGS